MDFEILETKERVQADNAEYAQKVRAYLREHHVFLVNLMGSPGAGKTSTLLKTIEALQDTYRIGVMEADVDSSVDSETIAKTNTKVIQLHSGGSCHMTADMTLRGLEKFGLDDVDVVFLENIGNLVCPAEFDVGANKRVMILSVPEGDDKPLKYPLMFEVSDVMLVNKIDTAPIFDFDLDKAKANARMRNTNIEVFPISALNGDGFDQWIAWLKNAIEEVKHEDN